MAEPVSVDLRTRIVDAHAAGEGSYDELAARFQVGRATISRVLRRFRERGNVAPDGHGGGQPPKIEPEEYPKLRALVAEQPDRTVEQISGAWELATGVSVSRSAMMRTLRKAGLTWKKNGSDHPSNSGRWCKIVARRGRGG